MKKATCRLAAAEIGIPYLLKRQPIAAALS
jgi:hypothetical protein